MKCDDCLRLMEGYIDGEMVEYDAAQISEHLATCGSCASEHEALHSEEAIYARYDRELTISPSMWNAILARTAQESGSEFTLRAWLAGLFATPRFRFTLSGALAVLLIAVMIGVAYLGTRRPRRDEIAKVGNPSSPKLPNTGINPTNAGIGTKNLPPKISNPSVVAGPNSAPAKLSWKSNLPVLRKSVASNQPDVLFTDVVHSDFEDQETATHVERAQNLLRSIKNLQVSEDDDEVDVTYEKAVSRRLLNENVVLRRDAEMSGKFPIKTLLGDLEPFLIDIANLPDKTTPNDLHVIQERMQKTEMVAALQSY